MERNSFIFYASFFDGIDKLPEENQLELYRAVCTYALTGELIELSSLSEAMFSLIKPQLDANNKRYEDGKKGGRPRKTSGCGESDKEKTSGFENKKPVVLKKTKNKKPNVNENENENVNVNENVNENKKEKNKKEKAFTKTQYAEFVSMREEEHQKLVDQYGEDFTKRCIETLDNYKGSSGRTYKSDYRAILSWVIDKVKEKQTRPKQQSGNPFLDIARERGIIWQEKNQLWFWEY